MEAQKKVEIVVGSLDVNEVIKAFENHGQTAYTRIEDISGRGDRGFQDGKGLAKAFSNDMLIFVLSNSVFEEVKEEIRQLIKNVGGMCLVSDVQSMVH